MKNYNILLYIAFTAIIVYLITRPIPKAPDVTPLELRKKEIDSLLKREYELREQIKADSIAFSRETLHQQAKIRRLEGEIRKINLARYTAPELDSVVNILSRAKTDTTYCTDLGQAREIVQMALTEGYREEQVNELQNQVETYASENVRLYRDFGALLEVSEKKYNSQVDISNSYRSISEVYKADIEKRRKGEKLLKVAIPVTFVAGLFIGR